MVVVNGSHGVIQTAVERYSLEIVLFDIRCNITHRLVEQVIHSDGRIAAVTLRNGGPKLNSELAPRLCTLRQLKQTAGIDLAAMLLVILISGRSVQVENDINPPLAALLNHPVKAAEIPFAVLVEYLSALIVIVEITVPERNSDAVEAHGGDIVEVDLGYPIVGVGVEQLVCFLDSEALGEHLKGGYIIHRIFNRTHPLLLNEPCTEINASERDLLPFPVNYLSAVGLKEIIVGYRVSEGDYQLAAVVCGKAADADRTDNHSK